MQRSSTRAKDMDLYSHRYDYADNVHSQPLGRGLECEYSHVWEIQGDNSPYTGITTYIPDKSLDRTATLNRELPSVPDITRTDRIYELTLSGKGIPGGNVIAAMNAQQDNTQGAQVHGNTAGYSRRPGVPVYFELESQQQHQQHQQQGGGNDCSV